MKIENEELHEYFMSIAEKVYDVTGNSYNREEIENRAVSSEYELCFDNSKGFLKDWYIGVWATGKGWDINMEYEITEGKKEIIQGGYGFNNYPEKSVTVFVVHKFYMDKFRPSYSDGVFIVNYKDDVSLEKAISELNNIKKHPVDAFEKYAYTDYIFENGEKKENKYMRFMKLYFENLVYIPLKDKMFTLKKHIASLTVKLYGMIDKKTERVVIDCRDDDEYKYFSYSSFIVHVVLKSLDTPYEDWKTWNRYMSKFGRKTKYSKYIDLCVSYDDSSDREYNRGVYWTRIPEIDEKYEYEETEK